MKEYGNEFEIYDKMNDPARDSATMPKEWKYKIPEELTGKQKAQRTLFVLYILLIIAGLCGLGFALLDDAGIRDFQSKADKAEVVVTKVEPDGSNDIIYVTYEYDRKMYYNISAGKAPKDRYDVASDIVVYISRSNPTVVMQDIYGRFIWLRNLSIGAIVLGIVLIAIDRFRKHLKNKPV